MWLVWHGFRVWNIKPKEKLTNNKIQKMEDKRNEEFD